MAEISLQRCPNSGCGVELHKAKKINNWRCCYEYGDGRLFDDVDGNENVVFTEMLDMHDHSGLVEEE